MTIASAHSTAMGTLSRLVLSETKKNTFSGLNCKQFQEIVALAHSNHVLMRAMETLRGIAAAAHDSDRYEWATEALGFERARIDNAISFLHQICEELAAEGCDIIVIKSLDHWPDLGSDLDLYTNAEPARVIHVMT